MLEHFFEINSLEITKMPMQKFLAIWILFSLLIPFTSSHAAKKTPKPPIIKAKSYVLIDYHSGQLIAEKNADERMEPASLTKMMSAYVVAREITKGAIKETDRVKISRKAWRMGGSRMFIEVGKKVLVKDLLKGVIVQSGNDATIALAEHVAGDEKSFVRLMNEQADALGLHETHFANATGLPHKDHYSTASDMAALGQALIRDFPNYYKWYSIKQFKFNKIKQLNRNKLLWSDSSVDGIKTGHTKSAGFCLVASAKRNGMRLIAAVLGTNSKKVRVTETNKLFNYGYRYFETHKLYAAYKPLTKIRIWKGEKEKLPLGLSEDLYITIPKGRYNDLDASMSINAEILAPVDKGAVYGTVNITLGDKNYAVRKMIALQTVREANLYQYLVDSVKLMFH